MNCGRGFWRRGAGRKRERESFYVLNIREVRLRSEGFLGESYKQEGERYENSDRR